MLELKLTDQLSLSVEAPAGAQLQDVGFGDRATETIHLAIGKMCGTIVAFAVQASKALDQASPDGSPDVEITCGMKVSASGDLILAKTSTEAHLTIKLAWKAKSHSDQSQ